MCRLFLTDHKYDLSERIEIAFEGIKINRRMTEVAVDQTIYFSGCRLGTGLLSLGFGGSRIALIVCANPLSVHSFCA